MQECNPLAYQEIVIMMDGMQIVNDDKELDIITAIYCVFSLYFVYDVAYPKQINNTLKFIMVKSSLHL